jgi:ankyrin repeat protein
VELLLRHGAAVDAIDEDGCTALHKACLIGHGDVAEYLLEHGANVERGDKPAPGGYWPHRSSGWTPLHYAAVLGNEDVGGLLLKRGAGVNATDKKGHTPLHEAAYRGHTPFVELLMANGADPNARTHPDPDPPWSTEPSKTPLDHAREAGFADTVAALGGNPNDPGLVEAGPYRIIIARPRELRGFLWFEGLDFEDVWIPGQADIKEFDVALRACLESSRLPEARSMVSREFVLANLRRYHREYAGFVKDGVKQVVCQMVLPSDFTEAPPEENWFTIIMDGGCGIVRVVFDTETKTIAAIACNGGA